MNKYLILIQALIISFLSNVGAEPDHQLRGFLGITSVTSKAKIEAAAYYFEIVVFKEGKEIARLPTWASMGEAHREIELSLMFNDKGMVKFIGEGSTSDLTDQLDWSGILKPTGGKAFRTGKSDKPIGLFDGFKVLGMVQIDQLGKGFEKFQTQSDLEMDDSIRRSIESAKGCVLIALKSGSGKEIEKLRTDSVNANKRKAGQAGAGKPASPSDSEPESSDKPQPGSEGRSQ